MKAEISRLQVSQREMSKLAQEKLIAEAASNLSQLLLQVRIASKEETALTAKDVLVNVRGLIRAFNDNGMSVIDESAEPTMFDARFHESALSGFTPEAGKPVQIRYPGIKFFEKVLLKAGVVSPETSK